MMVEQQTDGLSSSSSIKNRSVETRVLPTTWWAEPLCHVEQSHAVDRLYATMRVSWLAAAPHAVKWEFVTDGSAPRAVAFVTLSLLVGLEDQYSASWDHVDRTVG